MPKTTKRDSLSLYNVFSKSITEKLLFGVCCVSHYLTIFKESLLELGEKRVKLNSIPIGTKNEIVTSGVRALVISMNRN